MIKTIVITAPLAGLFTYWCSQLADNDDLKIMEIEAIVEHLPVTQGGYRILREYLETMSDDILALERLLRDFDSFMTIEESNYFSGHLNRLCEDDETNDDTENVYPFDDEWMDEEGECG